jgi:aldehyde dehydrogenase (NAD+)
VTLELGGKSPNIVVADADLAQAVPGSVKAFIANAGQACSAGTRCLVQRSIHDEFVEALTAAVKQVKVGGDEAGAIGPMMTEAQYDKVLSYYDVARKEGVKVMVGGEVPSDTDLARGWYVPPTVYANVRNDMRIAREEISDLLWRSFPSKRRKRPFASPTTPTMALSLECGRETCHVRIAWRLSSTPDRCS